MKTPICRINSIMVNGEEVRFVRPVQPAFANKMVDRYPKLVELNAKGIGLEDAAAVFGVSSMGLKKWILVLGMNWTAWKKRAKSLPKAAPSEASGNDQA